MKDKINIRFLVLILITLAVGFWRILQTTGHTPFSNFTPIGAMALFGGAYFTRRSNAYLFPLLTLLISDLVLMKTVYADYSNGFLYSGWYWTYIAFGLMVWIGHYLIKKVTFKNVLFSAIAAGLCHFIIANLGVWIGGGLDITTGLPYTRDFTGLMKCYFLAIPFFKNMLASNLLYSALLFGGFELVKMRFTLLAKSPIA